MGNEWSNSHNSRRTSEIQVFVSNHHYHPTETFLHTPHRAMSTDACLATMARRCLHSQRSTRMNRHLRHHDHLHQLHHLCPSIETTCWFFPIFLVIPTSTQAAFDVDCDGGWKTYKEKRVALLSILCIDSRVGKAAVQKNESERRYVKRVCHGGS
jgi:hypothetical protein